MPPLRLAALAAAFAWPAAAPSAAPEGPQLRFPLACTIGAGCEVQNLVDHDPGPGRKDYRCGAHTYDKHDGIDIRLPDMSAQRAGVAVLAAAAGTVKAVRDGVTDISIRAPGAPSVAGQECGNRVAIDHGGGWLTDYCHLAKGSLKVKAGDRVEAGQPIANVGLSGMTEFPHLHMSLRHGVTLVDPFAPGLAEGACEAGTPPTAGLWTADAARALAYKRGAVLNAGIAGGAATMEAVEAGGLAAANRAAPALVAYARAINLEADDLQEVLLRDPSGAVIGQNRFPPLAGPKAQYLVSVGARRPAQGWRGGTYTGTYRVIRGGAVVLDRSFRITL